MNTIQCPVCKQMLEGDFQMTDTVKCPSCETAFIPGKLISAQISKEEHYDYSTVRPKEIGWLITTWMTMCVLREILLSLFLATSIGAGNMMLFEALIGPVLLGVVVLPFAVFVAWKVFMGNNWARIVYNVCAPLGILQNSIHAFGMAVMFASPLYVSPLPNWFHNLNVFWALGIIVVHVCGLWWINKQQSIRWFKGPKQTLPSRPWWIWIIVGIIIFDILAFSLAWHYHKIDRKVSIVTDGFESSPFLSVDSFNTTEPKNNVTNSRLSPEQSNGDAFDSFVVDHPSEMGLKQLHAHCERIRELRNKYWDLRKHGGTLNINAFNSDKFFEEVMVSGDLWHMKSQPLLDRLEERVVECLNKLERTGKLADHASGNEDYSAIEQEIEAEHRHREQLRLLSIRVFKVLDRYQNLIARGITLSDDSKGYNLDDALLNEFRPSPSFWANEDLIHAFEDLLDSKEQINSQNRRKNARRIILPGGCVLEMIHCPKINPGFYVGKFEVTEPQWEAITKTTPASEWSHNKRPITRISFVDCQGFLAALNRQSIGQGLSFRLPTETEWKAACLAGGSGEYGLLKDGMEGNPYDMAWFKANSKNELHEVGEKEPNAWGLYDMHGNVAELTVTERKDSSGFVGVLAMGGTYFSANCTATSLSLKQKTVGDSFTGIRLIAESIPKVESNSSP